MSQDLSWPEARPRAQIRVVEPGTPGILDYGLYALEGPARFKRLAHRVIQCPIGPEGPRRHVDPDRDEELRAELRRWGQQHGYTVVN